MVKLMKLANGQFILTIPRHIIQVLGAERGDELDFKVDLKKQKIWVEKR